MRKYHKITPEGTKDLLFEECLTHRYVERTLADVFSSHGFHEVITPGLEFYDVFDTESSGIGQEVMYKMSDIFIATIPGLQAAMMKSCSQALNC